MATIWPQVVSSISMPSRSFRARVRASGSPGMRISPSGVTVLELLTWVMKSPISWAKPSADWKNAGVEDDAQHVVGDAVDAEVAARAAG